MDALDRLATILGWALVIVSLAYFAAHVAAYLLTALGVDCP
jgi:hypothetical protein